MIKEERNTKVYNLLSKKFRVSQDYKTIVIDEKVYEIPSFFNRNSIKSKNLKTWEMIFYNAFENETTAKIREIISKYKREQDKMRK